MIKERPAPRSLAEAIRFFADPDTALAFVVTLRWPAGVACPHCDAEKPSFLKSRRIWKCRTCKRQFSVKVGTIFEDSPLGLDKWLPALWMLANSKNGISSYELGRALGVTQKTAWFMLGRIRLAMQSKSFRKRMGGAHREVEVDESFVGGLAENMHIDRKKRLAKGRGMVNKTAVLGMLQRTDADGVSQVETQIVPNLKRRTLSPAVVDAVAPDTTVYTDAAKAYDLLGERGFKHFVIDHAVAYAQGNVHTNGLENFWSLLKRTIKGTYVSVDPFHLFRYLDEQCFRFNKRANDDLGRFVTVLHGIVGRRLTYKHLIGSNLIPSTT